MDKGQIAAKNFETGGLNGEDNKEDQIDIGDNDEVTV